MRAEGPETLGQVLHAFRRARKWSEEQMAVQLGLERDAYRQWQGDVALPDAEGFFRLCLLLDQPPLVVRRLVRASARLILDDALDEVEGRHSLPMAARSRGTWEGDMGVFVAANLPGAVHRALACWAGVDGRDPEGMAVVLHSLASAPAARREAVVDGVVASLELDGEAAMGMPPLQDEPGWGQP